MSNSGSRLKALSFLAVLAMLAGLWFAARDGDLLSAVVLSVLAALLLVSLGLAAALILIYIVSRINRTTSESIRDMADAQRSMANAMATQGRVLTQMPGGGAPALSPGAAYMPGLALPPLTTFSSATVEGETDEEIA